MQSARHTAVRQLRSPLLALLVAAVFAGATGCSSDPEPRPDTRLGPLGELLEVTERVEIANLSAPVDLVRDQHGRVHIYATSWADAYRAQGYLVARDRSLQLDILRRRAQGRLAALLGHIDSKLVEIDIAMRHVGLGRIAQQQYQELSGEPRTLLDAYADGVTQLFRRIRGGEEPLPAALVAAAGGVDWPSALTDWTGADSLAVMRLHLWLLSYGADDDIERQALLESMKGTFSPQDEDPQHQRRAGAERDMLRFAPAEASTTIAGPDASGGGVQPGGSRSTRAASGPRGAARTEQSASSGGGMAERDRSAVSAARRVASGDERLARAVGYVRAVRHARSWTGGDRTAIGSNSWVIAPALSATGNALLASDPHLELTAPAAFWPVSIHVSLEPGRESESDLHVAGVAMPGIPGVMLGHNEHVAWGAAAAGYDVSDVYAESLTADGSAVLFEGREVELQAIEETIEVRSGAPLTYTVQVVPHHGPVVPTIVDGQVQPLDPAQGALSVRWTGMESTDELTALIELSRARDVSEARAALTSWRAGAQSWMVADTKGNILWTSQATVPTRDDRALQWNAAAYEGLLPCLVLPGDGTAEWTGSWETDSVPWAQNPPEGFLAVANNDPMGTTLDNDPSDDRLPDGSSAYLGCSFSLGYRQGRIGSLIRNQDLPIGPEALQSIQADRRSPLGEALVPSLLLAIDNAREEHRVPGSHPQLASVVNLDEYAAVDPILGAVRDSLAAWRDLADYDAAAGVDPSTNAPLSGDRPEAAAAQATLLFHAWLVRFVALSVGDEMARLGRTGPTPYDVRAVLHLMSVDPATLATYITNSPSVFFAEFDTSNK